MQLYNLILLELNIFLKKFMHVFYCVAFVEDMVAGKTLLDYTILFSPNDYKKNGKKFISILQINMVKEGSLEFRLRKIDETRNYLLAEIKYNDLMSENIRRLVSI